MTSRISSSVRLVGLIVTTKQFEYTDNTVTCQYQSHISLDDLKALKAELEVELASKDTVDVGEVLVDDIYFVNSIIEKLENN